MPLPVRVRRQHPIGRYIADFAVPADKLVIEIDGGQHATAAARDAARTRMLEARGWRVIRFWNGDVMNNLDGVLETIAAEIAHTPSSPRPAMDRIGASKARRLLPLMLVPVARNENLTIGASDAPTLLSDELPTNDRARRASHSLHSSPN